MDSIANAYFYDAFTFLIFDFNYQYDGIDKGVVVLSKSKVFPVASSSVNFVHPRYLLKILRKQSRYYQNVTNPDKF